MTVAVTRGAEGLSRRAFSADEVRRLIEVGVIREDERIELIEGDLVPISLQPVAHDMIKTVVSMAMLRIVPDDLMVGVATTLQFGEHTLVDSDIAVIRRSGYLANRSGFAEPRTGDVLLIIEVAAARIKFNLELKARHYARHGIREYWVIDPTKRETHVHTGPARDGWSSVVTHPADATLGCDAVPVFSVRLADLG